VLGIYGFDCVLILMDCDVIKITDLSYGYCFWVLLAGYLFSVISVLISWVVMILEARIIVE
jgi:hypothetical protein